MDEWQGNIFFYFLLLSMRKKGAAGVFVIAKFLEYKLYLFFVLRVASNLYFRVTKL